MKMKMRMEIEDKEVQLRIEDSFAYWIRCVSERSIGSWQRLSHEEW